MNLKYFFTVWVHIEEEVAVCVILIILYSSFMNHSSLYLLIKNIIGF